MKKGNNFMFNLMTIEDAAKELKIAESTLRTWKRRGEIPSDCFKPIGSRIFIKIDKFKEFIDN